MKHVFANAALVLGVLALVGCSHGVMRGSVAMKTGENEAHVCMNKDEVKVGDRVAVFRNECPTKAGAKGPITCEKKRMGEGVVTEILNDHYSAVKFDSGVQFDEGSFVEKI